MKLILTAAVDKLGVPGDIVEVKDGYGRNYLLPRGYALVATKGAEKQAENLRIAREKREAASLDHAREVKDQLAGVSGVTVAVKTSEKGKVFGSVKNKDVALAVAKAGGPTLDADSIKVAKGSIRTTGTYTVEAVIYGDITADITFEVVSANH